MTIKFGLIGGGIMGEALLSRLIARGIYQGSEVIVSEPQEARRNFLEQQYGVNVTTDNGLVLTNSIDVMMLAVKPQILSAVAQELADFFPIENSPLIISVLAGVPLKQLETVFPQLPVVRVMPNTPATVGAGMTAICLGAYTGVAHQQKAQEIFSAVGEVVEVPEGLMDAVTGVSGSGPAYVALMVEALSDGGVAAGLPRPIAQKLALQTVLGTAQLMKESQLNPADMKDRVTSPGGTTIAAVRELERSGFRSALIEAVQASARRSQELGKG